MKKDTIKPCPFCGGDAEIFNRDGDSNERFSYDIRGLDNKCYLSEGADYYLSCPDAMDLWNTRTL